MSDMIPIIMPTITLAALIVIKEVHGDVWLVAKYQAETNAPKMTPTVMNNIAIEPKNFSGRVSRIARRMIGNV